MPEVTTAEAKERFSELLGRVEAGESITVTRYGEPVATFTPVKTAAPDMSAFRAKHGKVRSSAVAELLRARGEGRY